MANIIFRDMELIKLRRSNSNDTKEGCEETRSLKHEHYALQSRSEQVPKLLGKEVEICNFVGFAR